MSAFPELSPYRSLLDALNCGAFLVDGAGRITHANARLAQMLGCEQADLVGSELASLYDDESDRRRVAEAVQHLHGARENEFYLPRRDGTRMPIIFSVRPLVGEAPLERSLLFTVIDITPQKAAEAREHEKYEEIIRLSDTILSQALELKRYSEKLEERVRARTRELHEANYDAIHMLAVASEARDSDTGAHVLRIRNYSTALAAHMGIAASEAERIGWSAVLHDVGKISIADAILLKPGPLTDAERAQMQQHTLIGERILSQRPFFHDARRIARSHHENWDGSGYPDGLSGEAIPASARIVHVADVYDALSQPRVYKAAWPRARVIEEIVTSAGKQFDPVVVQAFAALSESGELEKIAQVG